MSITKKKTAKRKYHYHPEPKPEVMKKLVAHEGTGKTMHQHLGLAPEPQKAKIAEGKTGLVVWDSEQHAHVIVELDNADKDKILYMLSTGRTPVNKTETLAVKQPFPDGVVKNAETSLGRLESNVHRMAGQAKTLNQVIALLSIPVSTLFGEKPVEFTGEPAYDSSNLLGAMDNIHDYNEKCIAILEEIVRRCNDMI